ncbi:MAG: large-conductance mechanosensitive channel protein MscL [Lachnospiraceae bacterium]|nr:large-conductance mechanosensitive channel protein MscL [Lachnospiraceae bacterium]
MGLVKEFKEFISRGNVLDMAVGIIVGGAFTSIVTALVDNIITPIIGMISGGVDFSSLAVTVGSANLQYGAFIQAVINFLLVALVLFLILKAVNTAASKAQALVKKEEEEKEEAPAEPSEEVKLLTEIRDALKKK